MTFKATSQLGTRPEAEGQDFAQLFQIVHSASFIQMLKTYHCRCLLLQIMGNQQNLISQLPTNIQRWANVTESFKLRIFQLLILSNVFWWRTPLN